MELKTVDQIERAIGALPERELAELYQWLDQNRPPQVNRPQNQFGAGLLGSTTDAALLDEVVRDAYAERRRPSRPVPAL